MKSLTKFMDSFGAILLAIIWIAPLLFAFWAATHSTSDAVNLKLFSPWTLENFRVAWAGAPWFKYFINTFMLVTVILIGQFVLTTLAGFAFAQLQFPGKDYVFILVLMQLFILPEVLIVGKLCHDFAVGIAFKGVPIELHEAARIEGCGLLGILWRVYVPLAKPTYLAYALVSVSTHWNNFLWPLIVTNSPETRPLTVGLSIFGAPENGVDISIISAATLMSVAPLLIAFLIFQRQFVQAFLRAGIK
ncbi:L-arabinose transport system permease protein AraQ [Nymphon striatum]|nr:L-arabinose transport system permease protein AraQ [Nymphon striatum]